MVCYLAKREQPDKELGPIVYKCYDPRLEIGVYIY